MNNQEIIRREQYCQIVKEVTGSDQYLIVGIDVAKDKHHAFMGTAAGKVLPPFSLKDEACRGSLRR
jgi:hypothetical protein